MHIEHFSFLKNVATEYLTEIPFSRDERKYSKIKRERKNKLFLYPIT